ncbi:Retrovirus-related Pol polyprotein from transposon TNT 1-94 [Eumeta japonica]|uniref:Retrovirus-related Pol polyprotein from transposon TNT 1-94 n=1 Tax=Eumeta variegata TaxID=151549 RepID=A0A4C1Y0E3_EUMVA|nr:Retrovirus-related Pol polyprotein from transposon TNT 1-94 [Eumeta japonica]
MFSFRGNPTPTIGVGRSEQSEDLNKSAERRAVAAGGCLLPRGVVCVTFGDSTDTNSSLITFICCYSQSFLVNHRSKSFNKPFKKGPWCFNCNKYGHIDAQCKSKTKQKNPQRSSYAAAFMASENSELATNLLYVGQIIKTGGQVKFNDKGCIIMNKNNVIVTIATLINDMYQFDLKCERAYISDVNEQDVYIWLQRMGHLNFQDLTKTVKNTNGVKISKKNDKSTCLTRLEGKQKRLPFKYGKTKTTKLLELVHSDICGPMETRCLGAQEKLEIIQFYATTAFLYGQLNENILMTPPEGLDCKPNMVCKLVKSQYGLKQALSIPDDLYVKLQKADDKPAVGSLIHVATVSRPDIKFTVSQVLPWIRTKLIDLVSCEVLQVMRYPTSGKAVGYKKVGYVSRRLERQLSCALQDRAGKISVNIAKHYFKLRLIIVVLLSERISKLSGVYPVRNEFVAEFEARKSSIARRIDWSVFLKRGFSKIAENVPLSKL